MQQTVSEVKRQFNQLIASEEPVVISRNGKLVSVLVPFQRYREMYQAWQKDLDHQAAERAKHFHQGNSETVSMEELEQALRE